MNGKLKIITVIGALFTLCLITSASLSPEKASSSSYTVVCVYESIEIPSGSKALDSWGNLKEINDVYVPTKVDKGKYTVELTRIDSNFYRIYGTDLYIETQYCYEYATREEVVLNITSNYGYARGEVVFF